ncbi:MAG TPA: hypothetical protein ENK51_05305 [Gammaproteobacteria bacterium]|nr:hypothetical protein [Gammaproteobacteria bacterium]
MGKGKRLPRGNVEDAFSPHQTATARQLFDETPAHTSETPHNPLNVLLFIKQKKSWHAFRKWRYKIRLGR